MIKVVDYVIPIMVCLLLEINVKHAQVIALNVLIKIIVLYVKSQTMFNKIRAVVHVIPIMVSLFKMEFSVKTVLKTVLNVQMKTLVYCVRNLII